MNRSQPQLRETLILIERDCPCCQNQIFQKKIEYFDKNGKVIGQKYSEIICVECKKFQEKPKIPSQDKISGFDYPPEHWGF